MGFTITRVRGRSMEPVLPHGTIALFRTQKRPKKDDVVLVQHPALGKIARKVRAVGRKGNVHLKATSRRSMGRDQSGKVPMDAVRGVFVRRLGRIALPFRKH